MSYGLLGIQSNMEDQAMQGLGQAAQIQSQNKQAEDQMKAAKKQQTMSAVGMGAAIGMAGGPAGMAIGAGVGFIASRLF